MSDVVADPEGTRAAPDAAPGIDLTVSLPAARGAAATLVPSVRVPDDPAGLRPLVARALALGWTMTTLYRGLARAGGPAPARPDFLPGDAELSPSDAALRHLDRARRNLQLLAPTMPADSAFGPPAPMVLLEDAQTKLLDLRKRPSAQLRTRLDAVRQVLMALHVRLFSGLAAADIRLGKAYDLGTALADLALVVGEQAGQCVAVPAVGVEPRSARRLGRGGAGRPQGRRSPGLVAENGWPLGELLRLHDEVRDLATVLPEHSGAPVRESIAYWRTYLQGEFPPVRGEMHDDRQVLLLLQRQIHAWKALLLGEKEATDSLTLGEYLDAGLCTVRRIQREAARVVRAAWPVLALIALGASAVVVAALVYASGTAVSTTVFAAVSTALGAAWRSTRAPLVRVLDRYQETLKDAELDVAIARAISVVPPDAPMAWIEENARKQVGVPRAPKESRRASAGGRPASLPEQADGT
jgi:hypothetical protein